MKRIFSDLGKLTWLVGLFLVVSASQLALADTIKLKDGSVLKGKVTAYQQGKFKITIVVGSSTSQHTVSVEDIESIEFDEQTGAVSQMLGTKNSPPAVEQPRAETKPTIEAAKDEPLIVRPAIPGAEVTAGAPPIKVSNTPIETPTTPAPTPAEAVGDLVAEKSINVAAAADWTSTEIKVVAGQRVQILATGEIEINKGTRSGPNGLPLSDPKKLISNRPTGALIAVVGQDNDDFIFVGSVGSFVAERSGTLFLSVNEANLSDNNGSFAARIRVFNK